MSSQSSLPIYARLGERELSVRWAWFRPEVQVGDMVRLPTGQSGDDRWQSFRVIRKQFRVDRSSEHGTVMAGASTAQTIHLDVEPLAFQD